MVLKTKYASVTNLRTTIGSDSERSNKTLWVLDIAACVWLMLIFVIDCWGR